jgi:hypothetical protein
LIIISSSISFSISIIIIIIVVVVIIIIILILIINRVLSPPSIIMYYPSLDMPMAWVKGLLFPRYQGIVLGKVVVDDLLCHVVL